MKNKFTFTISILFFLCLLIAPYKVSAYCYSTSDYSSLQQTYSNRGLSGSGIEAGALDTCLNQIRTQNQILRNQQTANQQINTQIQNNNVNVQPSINSEIYVDQWELLNKAIASLKSEYGQNNFSACYSPANGCDSKTKDLTNPYNYADCLDAVKLCLKNPQKLKESYNQLCVENNGSYSVYDFTKNICSCQIGYSKKNGVCVTNDQACNITFPNSTYLKEDNVGKRICDCKTGYTWNDARTSCIIAPVLTNDQICTNKYGSNTFFKELDKEGTRICDCKTGYQWNEARTSCILTPAKTQDQICKETYGTNSFWTNVRNSLGETGCVCNASNSQWNPNKTQCITKVIHMETCEESYGPNSIIITDGSDGISGRHCGCKTGYKWNSDDTCVPISVAPVKTNNQICQDNYGPNSIWTNTLNSSGGLMCDCASGYQFNQGQTQCIPVPVAKISNESKVTTSDITSTTSKGSVQNIDDWKDPAYWSNKNATNTEVVKPKSFWSRFKGLFGFK
jgi:hypothetical protein